MDLQLTELGQYYGTENYYKDALFPFFQYTDGVKYVKMNGYDWLVVAIAIRIKLLPKEQFLAFTLQVTGSTAELITTDGNENRFKFDGDLIEYTDAAVKELKFFYTGNTLMLVGEY